MHHNIELLKKFLGDDFQKHIPSTHPLMKILHFEGALREEDKAEIATMSNALRYMMLHNPQTRAFLENKKHDLINGDLKSQTATLAEIIAYYSLSSGGFKINYQKTGNEPTADFIITTPENEEMIVEVRCRGLCDEATQNSKQKLEETIKKINENKKRVSQNENKPCILTSEPIEIRPYGYSKDSATADAISKICSTKKDEHQLSNKLPSILWLDIGVMGDFKTGADLINPLNTYQGGVTSGHFWYGFYGEKGLPIYTNYQLNTNEYEQRGTIEKMAHEGRFNQKTKLSGCIIRSNLYTCFYENPSSINPVSNSFRKTLFNLPHFSLNKSVADFYPNMIKEKNNIFKKEIYAFLPQEKLMEKINENIQER